MINNVLLIVLFRKIKSFMPNTNSSLDDGNYLFCSSCSFVKKPRRTYGFAYVFCLDPLWTIL